MKKSLFSLLIPLAVLTLAVFVVGPGNVGAQATSTPSITVLSPNGGEKWQVGSTQNITWKNSDLLNASNVQIGIRDVRYSTEGGERSETVIVYSVPNTGTYSWTIPRILTSPLGNTMDLTVTDNPVYKIAVSSWTSSTVGIGDVSDGPFSIVSSASTPCYTFTTNLRAGDSGNDVAALQKFLIAKGFDIPAISSGKVDPGYFGLATARALGNYQSSVGINEKLYGNAYFGPQTRASVNSSCIPASNNLKFAMLPSPADGTVVEKGKSYDVVAYKLMAGPSSDMDVKSLSLDFNNRIWLYASTITLKDDTGAVIGQISPLSASNVTEIVTGSDYRVLIPLSNYVVKANQLRTVTANISFLPVTDRATTTIYIIRAEARAVDKMGVTDSEVFGTGSTAVDARSFMYMGNGSTNSSGNIVATLNANSPLSRTVQISSTNKTENVVLAVFNLKSQNVDSTLQALSLKINSSKEVTSLFGNLKISVGPLTYSVLALSNTYAVFTNMIIPLPKDVQVPVTILGTINADTNGSLSGTTASIDLVANSSNIAATDSAYKTVPVTVGVVSSSNTTFSSGSAIQNAYVSTASSQFTPIVISNSVYGGAISFTFTFTNQTNSDIYFGTNPISTVTVSSDAASVSMNSLSAQAPANRAGDTSSAYIVPVGTSRTFTVSGAIDNKNGTTGLKTTSIKGLTFAYNSSLSPSVTMNKELVGIAGLSYSFVLQGDSTTQPCSIGPSPWSPTAPQRLFNVDFGKWIQDGKTSRYTGPAIVGSSGDIWNVTGVPWCDGHNKTGLKNADGTQSQIVVQMSNLGGSWGNGSGVGVSNDMLSDFSYPAGNKGGNAYVTLSNAPAGNYDLYLYNKTGNASQNGDYTVSVGSRSYGHKVMTTDTDSSAATSWQENNQFVVFRNIQVNSGEAITVLIQPSVGGLHDAQISGLQLAPVGTPAAVVYTQYQGQSIIPTPPPVQSPINITNYPGFFIKFSKDSYGSDENIVATINRADGSTIPYTVDSYIFGNNGRVSLRSVSVGQGTRVTFRVDQQSVYMGPGQYGLLLCDGGQKCNGGVNTNSAVFNVTNSVTDNPIITTPITPTLTVTTSGDGEVRTSDGKYSCGGVCALPYNAGTRLTLSPMANKGSNFTGWSGGLCSGTGSCTITLNSDASVSATFAPIPATASPTISSFTASPSSIATGQYTTLSWSSVNASDCIIFGGGSTPISGLPASGSRTVGPLSAASTYTLYCNGSNGQRAQANTSVTVKSPESPSKVTPVNTTSIWDSVSKYFPW